MLDMQFHEILLIEIMNKLIYYLGWSKNFVKTEFKNRIEYYPDFIFCFSPIVYPLEDISWWPWTDLYKTDPYFKWDFLKSYPEYQPTTTVEIHTNQPQNNYSKLINPSKNQPPYILKSKITNNLNNFQSLKHPFKKNWFLNVNRAIAFQKNQHLQRDLLW